MPFLPNINATVTRSGTQTDVYGQVIVTSKAQKVRIAIVSLDEERQKTSVRTDVSASRGNASENVAKTRLLFPTSFEPVIGDRVKVLDRDLEVKSVFPRHDVPGRLDHYQVDCEVWSKG